MELLAEDVDRDDSDAVLFKIAFPGVDLIVSRYLSPFHEIIDGWIDALFPRLAFNREQGLSLFQNHKLHFTFVRVAQIAELHAVAFRIFPEMTELQQVGSNEILESRTLGGP